MNRPSAWLTMMASGLLLAACGSASGGRPVSSRANGLPGSATVTPAANCTPHFDPPDGPSSAAGTHVVNISFADQGCKWFVDADAHFGGGAEHLKVITCSAAGYGRSGRGDVTIGVREIKSPGYERDRRHGVVVFESEEASLAYRADPSAPSLGKWRFSWD